MVGVKFIWIQVIFHIKPRRLIVNFSHWLGVDTELLEGVGRSGCTFGQHHGFVVSVTAVSHAFLQVELGVGLQVADWEVHADGRGR